jgi:hypothetical protein
MAFVHHMTEAVIEEELRRVQSADTMHLVRIAASQAGAGIGGAKTTKKARKRYERWLRDAIRNTEVQRHQSVRDIVAAAIAELNELKTSVRNSHPSDFGGAQDPPQVEPESPGHQLQFPFQ